MRFLLAAIIVLIGIPSAAYPDNWPQWRGATENGVSNETGLPTRWSKDDDLDERMVASPAISGGQIFIRTDSYLFCIGKKSSGLTRQRKSYRSLPVSQMAG
jgi:hypothetical protein